MDLLRLIAKFIFVLYLLKNRIAMEKMRQNLQETILSGDRGCKTGGVWRRGEKFRSLSRKPPLLYLSTNIAVLQRVTREKTGDSAAGLW